MLALLRYFLGRGPSRVIIDSLMRDLDRRHLADMEEFQLFLASEFGDCAMDALVEKFYRGKAEAARRKMGSVGYHHELD